MPSDAFPVEWTECSLSASSSECVTYIATSSLPISRDSGDIVFILGWILLMVSFPVMGMIINSFSKSPRAR